MAWQDIPKAQRIAVLVAVPLLAAGVFGYFAWQDLGELGEDPKLEAVSFLQRDTKRNLWKDIRSLESQIEQHEDQIARIPDLEEELERLNENKDELEARLPTKAQVPEIRRHLEAIARNVDSNIGFVDFQGLNVQEESPGSRGGSASHTTFTYQCQFQADMNGLIHYINEIENDERFMSLVALTVNPGDITVDAEAQELVRTPHTVNMSIRTFVYHPPAQR